MHRTKRASSTVPTPEEGRYPPSHTDLPRKASNDSPIIDSKKDAAWHIFSISISPCSALPASFSSLFLFLLLPPTLFLRTLLLCPDYDYYMASAANRSRRPGYNICSTTNYLTLRVPSASAWEAHPPSLWLPGMALAEGHLRQGRLGLQFSTDLADLAPNPQTSRRTRGPKGRHGRPSKRNPPLRKSHQSGGFSVAFVVTSRDRWVRR